LRPSTLSAAQADIRDRFERNDITEAADHADPIESAEHAEPIDPIAQTEPTDPIERTEPSLAIDNVEFLAQRDRRDDATCLDSAAGPQSRAGAVGCPGERCRRHSDRRFRRPGS
jgi:hypothetical protein